MTFTVLGISINCSFIFFALIIGFLLGRLWEILLAEKGGSLSEAIMTAKAIRKKLK